MKVLNMLTSEDMKRLNKDVSYERISLLQSKVKQLDKSLSIALEINDKYQRENKKLEENLKEAGRINQLHQELIEELKADLARAKEEHQYDNLVHAEELRKAFKK